MHAFEGMRACTSLMRLSYELRTMGSVALQCAARVHAMEALRSGQGEGDALQSGALTRLRDLFERFSRERNRGLLFLLGAFAIKHRLCEHQRTVKLSVEPSHHRAAI